MNTKQAKAIVPPEPHSTGTEFRKAWSYMPRWLQIILLMAFIAGNRSGALDGAVLANDCVKNDCAIHALAKNRRVTFDKG